MSNDPNASNGTTPTASVVEQLVGPGKKFASVDDLAAGKLQSDQFISKLTDENKQLRALVSEQDKKIGKIEARVSILDRLGAAPDAGNQPDGNEGSVVNHTPASSMTAEDVLRVVEQADVKKRQAQNKSAVDTVLAKQLGTNAGAYVLQRAGELGISPQQLGQLALDSPQAFYTMLGIDPNASNSGSMHKGVGPTGPSNNTPIRNEAFYNAEKERMGVKKFYLDRKLQLQLHNDMQTLGDAFYA